ncbi:UDPglucose 6-dehydrogenase [Gracilibacillus ureilyticus]|uniref:UDP-glucose 6-dehydrogenase n=1 Tax=Gracilibacillus ureilyticus TaxID=531814 RepID=A0A1H9R4K3_9BACI|nr:nucleotide sugar dehydrogenase [Gracilibacillus ureilyticus]SER67537.1 UDPglucose 6-dehydrogenase [Gracilibacillus ureilyticus]
MNITVVGTGYVGLSNAVILAQKNRVMALDILQDKVDMINERKSPITDPELEQYMREEHLTLKATTDFGEAVESADYVIIATPTNYDEEEDFFDTYSVETLVERIFELNTQPTIIIKSTVPVGFTEGLREKYGTNRIIFSPEFLREGRALYDNLYPSRIVVGDQSKEAETFAKLLVEGATSENIPVLLTNSTEAEAIKLFANTYLAMRVAFFNELDTYAEVRGLDTKQIVEGVGLDPRIGDHYNNPSFGYGGYCLPKDTKQLLANYNDVPNNMMKAIVESNQTRKDHITNQILRQSPKVVGIYRLVMKTNADNFRDSAVLGVMEKLLNNGVEVIVYEPSIMSAYIMGADVENNLEKFKKSSDFVIANRITDEITDILDKVYTRDIYHRD